MKKLILLFIVIGFSSLSAQFKGDESKPVDIKSGILNTNPSGSLFSLIDPSNFHMNHTFEMSYSAFGGNGMALGIYTNRLSYDFSENFNVELNTSFVNSPYNSLGEDFTKSINGIYIDRARINYNPSKDFKISLQFSNSPFSYYNHYYYRGYSPFSRFRFYD